MSYIISISDDPNDDWMLNNSVTRAILALVLSRVDDDDVRDQLEALKAIHGVLLHRLYDESPWVALRFRDALLETAAEIAQGEDLQLVTGDGESVPLELIRPAFQELVSTLARFPLEDS